MRLLHRRLASTFPLCFLAGRISYSGCVWFTVYRQSSLGLLLLQHVSERSLQPCLRSLSAEAGLVGRQAGETTSISSPHSCQLFFHPASICTHAATHRTTQSSPSQDEFLMSHACWFVIFSPPPTCQVFTVSPYQVIKNKIPRLTRRGLTQDYFNGRIHPVFGSTSALIPTLFYCVLIHLDVLLYFCMLRLTGVPSCNFF